MDKNIFTVYFLFNFFIKIVSNKIIVDIDIIKFANIKNKLQLK